MKKLVYLILITSSINAFGQTYGLNEETGLLTYEEVLNFDSMKAEDIYVKVKEWAILTFRNSEEVIVGDNEPSLVKVNYITEYFNNIVYTDFFTSMTVRIRDGAIKVVIDDMREITSNNKARSYMFKKEGTLRKWKGYVRAYDEIEAKCKGFTQELAKYILEKDDW